MGGLTNNTREVDSFTKTKNICVKRFLGLPLFSVKWNENGIALMLFKFLPIFKLQCPKYKQIGENVWEAM